jgi:hypothetical protein
MNRTWPIIAGCVSTLAAITIISPIAAGHHSGAEYDTSRQLQLTGVVKEFRWTNPHVRLEVTVDQGKDPAKNWRVEAGTVGMMSRAGWSRTSLRTGDKVTLVVYPGRSGDAAGALMKLILPDGRVLGNGVPDPAAAATLSTQQGSAQSGTLP